MIKLGIGERKVIHEGHKSRIVAVGKVGWKFNLVVERRRKNAMEEVSWVETTSITQEELLGIALHELVEEYDRISQETMRLSAKAHTEDMGI